MRGSGCPTSPPAGRIPPPGGRARPGSRRRRLLVNLVIIAGALAALLTAPPAVGGKPFTDWLQQLFHSTAPAWQFLCLFACLASLASVIAIQVQKSNNYEEHIVRAQGL